MMLIELSELSELSEKVVDDECGSSCELYTNDVEGSGRWAQP
jgi:hypothetical protein